MKGQGDLIRRGQHLSAMAKTDIAQRAALR